MTALKVVLVMQGGAEWIGGAHYIENLAAALCTLPEVKAGALQIDLLTSRHAMPVPPRIAATLRQVHFVEDEVRNPNLAQRIRRKVERDLLKRREGPHARFFERMGFDFAYPYLDLNHEISGFRSAAWIPDLQHKVLPEYFTSAERATREAFYRDIASHAPTVVLSSRCAAEDYRRHYAAARAEAKIMPFRTVPDEGWYDADAAEVTSKYNLPKRFLLMCNQFWTHKNHLLVLRALRELSDRGTPIDLVCTGHVHDYRDPGYSSRVLQSIHALRLSGQVYLLGLVPRAEQIQLIRSSIAIVQPSLFEGWSSIVEDARCFGKSMVLSDIGVHREQNPPRAVYFDPSSVESLASALEAQWQRAGAGPDAAAELSARAVQEEHVSSFARAFLNIAAGASGENAKRSGNTIRRNRSARPR